MLKSPPITLSVPTVISKGAFWPGSMSLGFVNVNSVPQRYSVLSCQYRIYNLPCQGCVMNVDIKLCYLRFSVFSANTFKFIRIFGVTRHLLYYYFFIVTKLHNIDWTINVRLTMLTQILKTLMDFWSLRLTYLVPSISIVSRGDIESSGTKHWQYSGTHI